MPLAPLEAAGSGLPILLSDIEGHRFLKPWAHFFDPRNPRDGAQEIQKMINLLHKGGENGFIESRWAAASPLREQWGSQRMASSYARIFQSAGLDFKGGTSLG